jgi:hypothetical protein
MITKGPYTLGALALAAGVALLASGCGTTGGATTCNAYSQMDYSDQQSTVLAMMKQHADPTPPSWDVTDTELSVNAYCMINGGNAQIGGIYQP